MRNVTSSKYALMQQASIGLLDTLFKYDVLLLILLMKKITQGKLKLKQETN